MASVVAASCSSVVPPSEQFRLPADYNFSFYETHEDAARSFYAAHYAHFGVYEAALAANPEERDSVLVELEGRVRDLVVDPPRFEPPAELIAPSWSRIAYPTARTMEWTHMLHSQLYDILTDPWIDDRRAAGERAIAYYLSNGISAFSTRGYGHRWMVSGGSWSGVFAGRFPDLNGVLWAYHWHHAAVYEALMEPTERSRTRELNRVIRTFVDSVLVHPPETMPLTAEVAPRFAAMFPAAAHIFDNLHMMHDVANDIMVDDRLDREEKAAEIERMRRNMSFVAQDGVMAPGLPMGGSAGDHSHVMSEGASRVPTLLPDGEWLPQGHPDARIATMEELMAPLGPAGDGDVPVEDVPPVDGRSPDHH